MMKCGLSLLAALAALAAAGDAGAQSLKSLRTQDAEQAALAHQIDYTNSVCGTHIRSSIDWTSLRGWPANANIVEVCDGALGALEAMCRSDDGKNRVRKVAAFVCAGDGAGPSFSGSTLRYGASPSGDGFSEMMRYIQNAL